MNINSPPDGSEGGEFPYFRYLLLMYSLRTYRRHLNSKNLLGR